MTEDTISIEVAFATPEKQQVVNVEVPPGTLIGEAVRLSGIGGFFPTHDLAALPKGVWSETRSGDYVVKAGDRVEVYRLLQTDAKEARRKRAQSQKEKEKAPRKKR